MWAGIEGEVEPVERLPNIHLSFCSVSKHSVKLYGPHDDTLYYGEWVARWLSDRVSNSGARG